MPSTNKRVNLTLPPDVYAALLDCVEVNAFPSCAALVTHILVDRLRSLHYLPSPLPYNDNLVKEVGDNAMV